MVHLILTGATGLVGSSVLSHILSLPATSSPVIHRLSILTRNPSIPWLSTTPPLPPAGTPSTNKHTQIEVIEHKDFSSYPPELLERLRGADACIWALGVSQNDVSRDEYVTITRDYALAAAKAFSSLRSAGDGDGASASDANAKSPEDRDAATLPKKFKFIYVSGEGATFTPRSWTPIFGRVKGETELALLRLARELPASASASASRSRGQGGVLSVYSARPGGVDGRAQPWLWTQVLREKRTAWQRAYLTSLMAPIRALAAVGVDGMHSPTEELGRVLVELALREEVGSGAFQLGQPGVESGGEGRVLGNKALRRLARGELRDAA